MSECCVVVGYRLLLLFYCAMQHRASLSPAETHFCFSGCCLGGVEPGSVYECLQAIRSLQPYKGLVRIISQSAQDQLPMRVHELEGLR